MNIQHLSPEFERRLLLHDSAIIRTDQFCSWIGESFEDCYAEQDLAALVSALPDDVLKGLTTLVEHFPESDEGWAGYRLRWWPGMTISTRFLEWEPLLSNAQRKTFRFAGALRRVIPVGDGSARMSAEVRMPVTQPTDDQGSSFVNKYLTMYTRQIITFHELVNYVMDGFEHGYGKDQLPAFLAALPEDAVRELTRYVDDAPHTTEEWAGTRSIWGIGYLEPMTYEESEQGLTDTQKHWYRFVVAFREAMRSRNASVF